MITTPVERREASTVPTLALNAVELVQLEHPMRLTHAALTIVGTILALQDGKEEVPAQIFVQHQLVSIEIKFLIGL